MIPHEHWQSPYRRGAGVYRAWVLEVLAAVKEGRRIRVDWIDPVISTESDWHRWFARHMQDRINRKVPDPRKGYRKAGPDFERACFQDRDDLDRLLRRRVRVYQFRTRAVRERFGHLLTDRKDD